MLRPIRITCIPSVLQASGLAGAEDKDGIRSLPAMRHHRPERPGHSRAAARGMVARCQMHTAINGRPFMSVPLSAFVRACVCRYVYHGYMSGEALTAFLLYSQGVGDLMLNLAQQVVALATGLGAGEKIFEIIAEKPTLPISGGIVPFSTPKGEHTNETDVGAVLRVSLCVWLCDLCGIYYRSLGDAWGVVRLPQCPAARRGP